MQRPYTEVAVCLEECNRSFSAGWSSNEHDLDMATTRLAAVSSLHLLCSATTKCRSRRFSLSCYLSVRVQRWRWGFSAAPRVFVASRDFPCHRSRALRCLRRVLEKLLTLMTRQHASTAVLWHSHVLGPLRQSKGSGQWPVCQSALLRVLASPSSDA